MENVREMAQTRAGTKTKTSEGKTQREVVDDFARYVSPGRVDVYRALGFDAVPGRREGVYMWDLDGRPYINCRSSGGVFNLGHRPPAVVSALKEALDVLDIGDHMLLSEQRARLAARLAELTPGDITYSFFTPSGGEACDVAIKLARGYTGRPGIVSAENGYHGHTGFALSAGDPRFKKHFEPLMPGFTQVPFGDIDAVRRAVDETTAAVIFETVPATAGIIIPPDDFYPAVREICNSTGALLILDEVQAGLGRTGRLWAIDEWGVVPDILVLGKGMSGGIYPLSAVCYRAHVDEFFRRNPFVHLTSFGGADLGCVCALAMLDEVCRPAFLDHVRTMGERFERGFAALKDAHPGIVDGWRRRGLMMAFELSDDRLGPMMTYALGRSGVIAVFSDFRPRAMQIMPPLVIQPHEVDEVLDAMGRALSMVEDMVAAGAPVPYVP
ncbi:MAG: aspartate aminotransferase family protein [Bacteroidota bacterium]